MREWQVKQKDQLNTVTSKENSTLNVIEGITNTTSFHYLKPKQFNLTTNYNFNQNLCLTTHQNNSESSFC